VVAVHHVGARIFVVLVDHHAADAALRNMNRQRRVNSVILRNVAVLLIGELQRLAGPWIVDLDARAFTAAAGRVDELRRADGGLLWQESDAKFLAARREDRILGVGIL